MLDTDQLRSFIAIVDTGSFTRAARRVNKTQSSVSMHIRRLEERLEKPLFVKAGRGVRLSADGERFVDYARTILHTEAAALETISGKGLRGQIRFGIPDDYAEAFFSDIMRCFSTRHPLAEMLVVCENSRILMERVQNGDIDIAIVTVSGEARNVEVLCEEPLRWVAAKNTAVERERPLPIAVSGVNCAWRTIALERLTAAGIPVKFKLVSSNYAMVSTAVKTGLALTILPESIVTENLRIVPEDAGLPDLAFCRIGLVEAPSSRVEGLATLADLIREIVGNYCSIRKLPEISGWDGTRSRGAKT